MAQEDGVIRIVTKITTKDAEESLDSLEYQIKKSAKYMDTLRQKMDALKGQKIPTQDYKDLQEELSKAEKELQKLVAQQEDWEKLGITSGGAWDTLSEQIEKADYKIDGIKAKMQSLTDSGKDFTLGEESFEYKQYERQLKYEEEAIAKAGEHYKRLASDEERLAQIRSNATVGNQRIIQTLEQIKQLEQEIADLKKAGVTEGYKDYDERIQKLSQLKQEVKGYNANISQAKESSKRLGNTAKQSFEKINKSAKKSNGFLSTMASRFKGLALSLLIFNQISKAFNAFTRSIKEGFGNLYNEVGAFKSAVDGLKASSLTLKNSFAAAFRPLVEIAIPYIQKAIDAMANLIGMFGQLTAAISGQKTYTKAIKQTTAALEEAKKAEEGYLSPLDEINKFQKDDSQSGAGGAQGTMFEEAPIESKFIDMSNKIREIFSQLFQRIDFGPFLESIDRLFEALKPFANNVGAGLKWFYTNVLIPIAEWTIEEALPAFLDMISAALGVLNEVIEALKPLAAWLWEEFLKPMGEWAGNTIIAAMETITDLLTRFGKWVSENQGIVRELAADLGILALSWVIVSAAMKLWNGKATMILTVINGIKKAIAILTSPVAGIAMLIGGIVIAVKNFVTMLKEGFSWLNEVFMLIGITLAAIGAIILGAPALVAGIVAAVVAAVATIVVVIHENWDAICQWFSEVVSWIYENVIQPVIEFFRGLWNAVSGFFSELWNDIVSIWNQVSAWFNDNVIMPVVGFFQGLWQTVSDFFASLWKDIVAIWEKVSGWFNKNVITPVTNFFKGVWKNVSEFFSNLWRDIKKVWSVVSNWFNQTIISPVREAFRTACNAIAGFFSGLWSGIKRGVAGAMNAVIGAIEGAINWIVNGINNIIRGFNSVVSWAAGVIGVDWGGVSLIPQVSLGRIPALATGTVVPPNREFMAVLGDNKREPEVVSPISTMKQAFLEAIAEAGGIGGGSSQPVILKVILDGKNMLYAMVKEGKVVQMSTGKNIFALE